MRAAAFVRRATENTTRITVVIDLARLLALLRIGTPLMLAAARLAFVVCLAKVLNDLKTAEAYMTVSALALDAAC